LGESERPMDSTRFKRHCYGFYRKMVKKSRDQSAVFCGLAWNNFKQVLPLENTLWEGQCSEEWEREAIVKFWYKNPLEGYRRCTYMMMDQDIVAVSPSSVYRVLSKAGLMKQWSKKESRKGSGFVQPLAVHEHWHIDISYLNIKGTFYYLCSVLDGCSRYIVHHEIRESMTESDVELVMQRAKEKYPDARPRIISDNGPQFIAKDFKEFIRVSGMTHVRTSPYYPQSNGKLERWHKTLKGECVRPGSPLSLQEARELVERYIQHYNEKRLHSAIGYVTQISQQRDKKLEEAREKRSSKNTIKIAA